MKVLENIEKTKFVEPICNILRPTAQRRGSINVTNKTTLLRLPRRSRGQYEDVRIIVNKVSFIYIFQKCQGFQDLMSSF